MLYTDNLTNLLAFTLSLIILSSVSLASNSDPFEREELRDGLVFMHIPKAGGSTTTAMLIKEYNFPACKHRPSPEVDLEQLKTDISHDKLTAGHIILRDLVSCNLLQRPIITFLRDPLARAISNLRYFKQLALEKHPQYLNWNINLNSLKDIRERNINFFNTMLVMMSPPGVSVAPDHLDLNVVKNIADYALKHLTFIGDIGDFSDEIERLNLALGRTFENYDEDKKRENITIDQVERITDPEVINYLNNHCFYERELYKLLLSKRRWRLAITREESPNKRTEIVTMPEGFDPDIFLYANERLNELGKTHFPGQPWKRRRWAMLYYFKHGAAMPYQLASTPAKVNLRWCLYLNKTLSALIDKKHAELKKDDESLMRFVLKNLGAITN